MLKEWNEEKNFYPTPRTLLEEIFKGCAFGSIETVLEPSAGKGDIVDFIKEKSSCIRNHEISIDCVEIDKNLRNILKGKGCRVVHDDFLTFQTFRKYDLIVMNPPFIHGTDHLMKAMEMQADGGSIVCILNASTLRESEKEKDRILRRRLQEAGAEVRFYKEAFSNAERQTNVDIAVIKLAFPEKEKTSFIREKLQRAAKVQSQKEFRNELCIAEIVQRSIDQYNLEVASGLRLIEEYESMQPYLMQSLKDTVYNSPIISLKINGKAPDKRSRNAFVETVRQKYWSALFQNEQFTGGMTSAQLKEYRNSVHELRHYDFSFFNIKTLQEEMSRTLVKGIEECILDLFETFTHEYSYYPECTKNKHYYSGWSTNKSWIINQKVIIPLRAYSDTWRSFKYGYDVYEELLDVEKVFSYLAGCAGSDKSLYRILQLAERNGVSKNIETRYFMLTFYKKGTCHITFKDEELLKRFNIFGSRKKGWLPPSYGKKRYQDMEPEERAVIDAFEGKASYEKVYAERDRYLYECDCALLCDGALAAS